ncbi:MAG: hypothetical protein Q4B14_06625, partial [Clostridia bacterium]|nr:hypothetical protein [Clostridia bacterium]
SPVGALDCPQAANVNIIIIIKSNEVIFFVIRLSFSIFSRQLSIKLLRFYGYFTCFKTLNLKNILP